MSRIGKKPVKIPAGVKVELNGQLLKISGSSSSLTLDVHQIIKVAYDSEASEINVSRTGDERFARSMHGTIRAHIANMVEGVTKGFEKKLLIYGTGYGVKVQGSDLSLSVGYASAKMVKIPQSVTVDITTPNSRGNDVPAEFILRSPDKYAVGQFASVVRRIRPPEPYLGKGIRYAHEVVKRKVGKAFGTGA